MAVRRLCAFFNNFNCIFVLYFIAHKEYVPAIFEMNVLFNELNVFIAIG